MNINLAIRTARQQSGLTLRELAIRANTSHSALAAYESGSKVPNVETIATVFADLSFLIKSNNKAVTKGININDSNI